MTQPYDAEGLPSPSSARLQLARLKADMSQRELAARAGVPVTMISALVEGAEALSELKSAEGSDDVLAGFARKLMRIRGLSPGSAPPANPPPPARTCPPRRTLPPPPDPAPAARPCPRRPNLTPPAEPDSAGR